MHKVAVMAAAMIAALGGQSIGGRRNYGTPQPEPSKEFNLSRAAAKRTRKAAIRVSLADRGAIGRVAVPVAVEPVAVKKPRAKRKASADV